MSSPPFTLVVVIISAVSLTTLLAVGGYDNARAEIEDLLRSSLVYHQTIRQPERMRIAIL
jgi:hypothetical protein